MKTFALTFNSIQLSPEVEVNSGYWHRDAKRRGMYLALFTDPEAVVVVFFKLVFTKSVGLN